MRTHYMSLRASSFSGGSSDNLMVLRCLLRIDYCIAYLISGLFSFAPRRGSGLLYTSHFIDTARRVLPIHKSCHLYIHSLAYKQEFTSRRFFLPSFVLPVRLNSKRKTLKKKKNVLSSRQTSPTLSNTRIFLTFGNEIDPAYFFCIP